MTCYCEREIDTHGTDSKGQYESTSISAKYKILEDIMKHMRNERLSDHDIRNILLLIHAESKLNPDAVSHTFVVGLLQVTQDAFEKPTYSANKTLWNFIFGDPANHTQQGEADVQGYCAVKNYNAPIGSPERYYLLNDDIFLSATFDRRNYMQSLNVGIAYYFQLKRRLTDGLPDAERTTIDVAYLFKNGWGGPASEKEAAAAQMSSISPQLNNTNLRLPWEILSALTGRTYDIYSYMVYMGEKYGFEVSEADYKAIGPGLESRLSAGDYEGLFQRLEMWRKERQEVAQSVF